MPKVRPQFERPVDELVQIASQLDADEQLDLQRAALPSKKPWTKISPSA